MTEQLEKKETSAQSGGLTHKEKQLVRFIRELGWGDMKIRVENGQPVLIYEAVRTIRLDDKPLQQRKKDAKPNS